jgi:hypothetical protein
VTGTVLDVTDERARTIEPLEDLLGDLEHVALVIAADVERLALDAGWPSSAISASQ